MAIESTVEGGPWRERALALRSKDVRTLHFDPLRALRVVKKPLVMVSKHREFLVVKCPAIDLELIEALPRLCLLVSGAQRDFAAAQAEGKGHAWVLIKAALAWRRQLLGVARVLAGEGRLPQVEVRLRSRDIGTRKHLLSISGIVAMLEPHRSVVTSFLGASAFEHSLASAHAALDAITIRNRDAPRAVADLRDRYATLLLQGYDRLRVAVALLTSYAAAEKLVGTLHPKRMTRSKGAVRSQRSSSDSR